MQGKQRALSWIIWILILGALGGAAYWYWGPSAEKPTEYRTAPIVRGEITQLVTATGQLNPVVNVQVGSQISGRIQELSVDFNSKVTNGQVIAQIDPSTYKANVREAEGQLARTKAAFELAQIDARRAEELAKNHLIPQSDLDKAHADLHQAEADVTIREADLERARVDLARTTIYSPIDGVVISRNVDVGQTVAASLNAPTLFVIANDLTKMQINAMVSEADVGGVEEGQNVRFTVDAFPQLTFHGRVSQIRNSPTTVQNVVSYDTVIEVNNKDQKLKPGMTASVYIVVAERQDALKIPNAALRVRPPEDALPKSAPATGSTNPPAVAAAGGASAGGMRGQGNGAGRFGGGRGGGGGARNARAQHQTVFTVYFPPATPGAPLEPVQVKTGISDGSFTEVLSGLKEGDIVVTGINQTAGNGNAGPPRNPFGGGFRRFR